MTFKMAPVKQIRNYPYIPSHGLHVSYLIQHIQNCGNITLWCVESIVWQEWAKTTQIVSKTDIILPDEKW